jgi:hypothetical protein
VEPLGVAALLAPTAGVGEEPIPANSLAVFFDASLAAFSPTVVSSATFFAIATPAAYFSVAASLAATSTADATGSPSPGLPVAITDDVSTIGSGCSTVDVAGTCYPINGAH